MFCRGMRNTQGDGDAVVAATAAQRLAVGPFFQLQNKGSAAVNVKLLLGAREIYDVLLVSKGVAVVMDFPAEAGVGGLGEAFYVSLDAAVDVYYQVQVLST